VVEFMTSEAHSKKGLFIMIFIGGFVDILASEFSFLIAGASVNVRDAIAIFSGIVGGPIVGISVGLIGGLYRMTGLWWSGFTGNMGYITALGCGIATICAGVVGAWLYKYKGITVMKLSWKKISFVVMIAAIWEVIHVMVFASSLMPFFSDLNLKEAFYSMGSNTLLPMIVGNCFGILVFLVVAVDTVRNKKIEEMERIKERVEFLERLVKKYEEYIGPVAKTIAKSIVEKEKEEEEEKSD